MSMKDFGFYRGINLGGWMSQCDYSEDRLNHFITEKDLEIIASWGLDHVRLPLDYNVLQREDGSFLSSGFDRVRLAVEWCRKYGLKIVLDLHKTMGFSFDRQEKEEGFFFSELYQERFYALWEELARRFAEPSLIAFELLNEVTDPSFIEAWNRIAGTCIRRIRPLAPETLILVGSYHNNSADAVPALDPPADDRVVYNFHCYDPLPFTHQGAPWVPSLDQSVRIPFPESGASPAYFEKRFESVLAAAEKNHACLYCGEYGVIDRVPPEDALEWFRAIHEVLDRHEISRAAWSYRRMDFGIADPRMDGVRDQLLRFL